MHNNIESKYGNMTPVQFQMLWVTCDLSLFW